MVGITPVYLNTFLHRKLYGLKAEVREAKGGDKQRVFSKADVFAIALVWMLFESGLRTDPIRRILKTLAGTKESDAILAADALLKSKAEYILVVREPRRPKGKTKASSLAATSRSLKANSFVFAEESCSNLRSSSERSRAASIVDLTSSCLTSAIGVTFPV